MPASCASDYLQLRVCLDLLLQPRCLKALCNRHTHKPFHKRYKQPPRRGPIYSAQMQQQSWQQPLFLPNKLQPSHRALHQVCCAPLVFPFGIFILPFCLSILPFGFSSLRASSPVMHPLFLSSHCSMLQFCATSYCIQYHLLCYIILPT